MDYMTDLTKAFCKMTGKPYDDCYIELRNQGISADGPSLSDREIKAFAELAKRYHIADDQIASALSTITGSGLENILMAMNRIDPWGKAGKAPVARFFRFVILVALLVLAVIAVLSFLGQGSAIAPFIYSLF